MGLDDGRPIRKRLAEANTRDDVATILGRRRFIRYSIGFGVVALAAAASCVYLIVEAATGSRSAWVLAALPALALLGVFCGVLGYGMAYFAVTGQRWSGAGRVEAIAGRLNSNI